MVIKVGDKLPDVELMVMKERLSPVRIRDYCGDSKVVLFGVPGAFTPQCSVAHVPGFLALLDDFYDKGVSKVVCVSVADPFVMDAWSKALGAVGKIHFISDGNGEFTRSIGLELDASALGMGRRSKRYSMLLDAGVVKALHIEEDATKVVTSSAERLLEDL